MIQKHKLNGKEYLFDPETHTITNVTDGTTVYSTDKNWVPPTKPKTSLYLTVLNAIPPVKSNISLYLKLLGGLLLIISLVIFTLYLKNPVPTWFFICILLVLPSITVMAHTNTKELIVGIILSVCVALIAIWISYDNLFNNYMIKSYKGEYRNESKSTNIENNRISCTQTIVTYKGIINVDTGDIYEFYSLFTTVKDEINITNKYVKNITITKVDTITDTLNINGVTCGDTIKTVNSKPYTDRNFSLIKTNKKFINSNWQLVDTTYYTNKTSKLSDWDIGFVFNNTRAEYRYDRYTTKYTLKMIDATKIDTLDSKEDAQGLLNAKCKDRATINGKLIYTEYDACKNNNLVNKIKVISREICGYAPITIEYDRGTISREPYSCWDKPNTGWYYE